MVKFNSLSIAGHLGRDPEMKYTPNGHAVTSFSVAVNVGRAGDEQEPEWFQIQAWGKLAETANEYLSKGSSVLIQGPVALNRWTGKDGVERSQMRVTAREIAFLGTKSDPRGDGESPPAGSLSAGAEDLANMPF